MTEWRDAYTVLGVSRAATAEEVRQTYLKLCKKYHPDLVAPEHRAEAEKAFKEISTAYHRLTQSPVQFGEGYTASYARSYSSTPGARAAARYAQSTPFSNGVVAAILCVPLAMLGFHLARNSNSGVQPTWHGPGGRPYGFWAPPENPFLREDMKPRMHSRWRRTTPNNDST